MLLIYGLLFMSMVAADMDSLSRLQEMKTTDEKYVNVENQEAEVGRGYSTSRASTSTDTVVEFPFNHVCASQGSDVNRKRDALKTAKKDKKITGAVQKFMNMIVNWTPANTICLGNLKVTDFEYKVNRDRSMGNLSCDLLALPSNPNTVLTNIGFSVNLRGAGAPGFCSYISKETNQYTFAMAFNRNLINMIVQFIPNVGLLLSKLVSPEISIGMSTGGHIGKQVRYWDGQDRTEIFNAHAYFKAKITVNPNILVEEFMGNYIRRERDLPDKFIALDNLMEVYIRFNDNAIAAVDCIFGGPCKFGISQLPAKLPNLIFGHQVVLASEGSVSINLNKIIGVLPSINLNLNESTFYKRNNGIFFTWHVSSIVNIFKGLFTNTIGQAFAGLNLYISAKFKCSLKNDEFAFMGSINSEKLECTVYFNQRDPIHCKYDGKFFAVIMDTINDIKDAGKAVYLQTKKWKSKTGKIIAKGAKIPWQIGQEFVDGVLRGVCLRHTQRSCKYGRCPPSFTGETKCSTKNECMCQKGYCFNKNWKCVRSNSAVEESVAIPYDNSEEQEEESIAIPYDHSEEQEEESVATPFANSAEEESVAWGLDKNTYDNTKNFYDKAYKDGTSAYKAWQQSNSAVEESVAIPYDNSEEQEEESVATPFGPSNPEGFNTKLPLIIICCTAASIGLFVAYRTKLTKAQYPPLLEEEL